MVVTAVAVVVAGVVVVVVAAAGRAAVAEAEALRAARPIRAPAEEAAALRVR